MSAVVASATVLCGCHLNVVSLEEIVNQHKGVGYGLTFLQFCFVSLASFPLVFSFKHMRFRPRRISSSILGIIVFLFWLTSAVNNFVFAFDISVPVHTTFRSLSLVVSMIAGYVVLGRGFSKSQMLCALLITMGIIVLTLESKKRSDAAASAQRDLHDVVVSSGVEEATATVPSPHHPHSAGQEILGIAILTVTVILSTLMGLMQDKGFKEARAREIKPESTGLTPAPVWAESLFWCHCLAAPLFFLQPQLLQSDVVKLLSTEESIQWTAVNCVTQLLCVIGVYQLVDRTSSFTVSLVLTIRKFLSITFSIFYFGHASKLGLADWFAMSAVTVGALAYPFVPKWVEPKVAETPSKKKAE